MGKRLAEQEEVREYGMVASKPGADQWIPVTAHGRKAWLQIGANDNRKWKTNAEAHGSYPYWGGKTFMDKKGISMIVASREDCTCVQLQPLKVPGGAGELSHKQLQFYVNMGGMRLPSVTELTELVYEMYEAGSAQGGAVDVMPVSRPAQWLELKYSTAHQQQMSKLSSTRGAGNQLLVGALDVACGMCVVLVSLQLIMNAPTNK